MLDLEPAARQVASVARGVRDDQLDNPTPCTEIAVAGLIDHLLGLSIAFRDAAKKVGDTAPPQVAAPRDLDPDWRTSLPERLDELVRAWQDPAAWEGMTEAGGVALPADVAAQVAIDELVMHGWDLARATGQDFACDRATTQVVFEFTKASAAPEEAAGREGVFGPVVAVPEDAPLFERALGYAGRNPAWTP
ncbi:MAG: TIGR03086 family metal-binding protein [Nocardioidaceae bacterium]